MKAGELKHILRYLDDNLEVEFKIKERAFEIVEKNSTEELKLENMLNNLL